MDRSAAPILPGDWMQVLEKIERSLEQALQQAHEAEPIPIQAVDREREAGLAQSRTQLDASLGQFKTCLRRADQESAALERLLDEQSEALARWLTLASECRQKLAIRVSSSVE